MTFLAKLVSDGPPATPGKVKIDDDTSTNVSEIRTHTSLSTFDKLLDQYSSSLTESNAKRLERDQSYLGFLVKGGDVTKLMENLDGKKKVVYRTAHEENLQIPNSGGIGW